MTLREAAQAALDAMQSFESGTGGLYKGEFANEIAALRSALATHQDGLQVEPVQPVAWIDVKGFESSYQISSLGDLRNKKTGKVQVEYAALRKDVPVIAFLKDDSNVA